MTASFGVARQLAVGRAGARFLHGLPDALGQLRIGRHQRVREHQEIRFLDQRQRQHFELAGQRTVHQAHGVAAAQRGPGHPARDQLLRQLAGALTAFVDRHLLGAQEIAHRVAELETDGPVHIGEFLAVPVEGRPLFTHQHVAVDMHACAGVGLGAARILSHGHALGRETAGEGAAHVIGLELLEAALPRHALVIEGDVQARGDLIEQLEIEAAAIERAPWQHFLALETQRNGVLGEHRRADQRQQCGAAGAARERAGKAF